MDLIWRAVVLAPFLFIGPMAWNARRRGWIVLIWGVGGALIGGVLAACLFALTFRQPPGAYPTAWVFPLAMDVAVGGWFGALSGLLASLAHSGCPTEAGRTSAAMGLFLIALAVADAIVRDGMSTVAAVVSLADIRSPFIWCLAWVVCGVWLSFRSRHVDGADLAR